MNVIVASISNFLHGNQKSYLPDHTYYQLYIKQDIDVYLGFYCNMPVEIKLS